LKNGLHERLGVLQSIATGSQNNDRYGELGKVLLVVEVAIHRQQDIESGGNGLSQQDTVLCAAPSLRPNGFRFVPDEITTQAPVEIFVEKYSHAPQANT